MKKKLILGFVLMVLVFGVVACDTKKTESEVDKKTNEQEEAKVDHKEETKKEEKEEPAKEEKEEPAKEEKIPTIEKVVQIYYGNENADGFKTEEVTLNSLSADELMNALSAKQPGLSEVKVIEMTEGSSAGEKIIDLNLTANFATYLGSQGSAGEYIAMGSICNTFLKAYDSEKIRITVEGASLETGHAEYPGYSYIYG